MFCCGHCRAGYVFTSDQDVVRATAGIAYIAALFQLSDGGQAAAGGVFRGMSRPFTHSLTESLTHSLNRSLTH